MIKTILQKYLTLNRFWSHVIILCALFSCRKSIEQNEPSDSIGDSEFDIQYLENPEINDITAIKDFLNNNLGINIKDFNDLDEVKEKIRNSIQDNTKSTGSKNITSLSKLKKVLSSISFKLSSISNNLQKITAMVGSIDEVNKPIESLAHTTEEKTGSLPEQEIFKKDNGVQTILFSDGCESDLSDNISEEEETKSLYFSPKIVNLQNKRPPKLTISPVHNIHIDSLIEKLPLELKQKVNCEKENQFSLFENFQKEKMVADSQYDDTIAASEMVEEKKNEMNSFSRSLEDSFSISPIKHKNKKTENIHRPFFDSLKITTAEATLPSLDFIEISEVVVLGNTANKKDSVENIILTEDLQKEFSKEKNSADSILEEIKNFFEEYKVFSSVNYEEKVQEVTILKKEIEELRQKLDLISNEANTLKGTDESSTENFNTIINSEQEKIRTLQDSLKNAKDRILVLEREISILNTQSDSTYNNDLKERTQDIQTSELKTKENLEKTSLIEKELNAIKTLLHKEESKVEEFNKDNNALVERLHNLSSENILLNQSLTETKKHFDKFLKEAENVQELSFNEGYKQAYADLMEEMDNDIEQLKEKEELTHKRSSTESTAFSEGDFVEHYNNKLLLLEHGEEEQEENEELSTSLYKDMKELNS